MSYIGNEPIISATRTITEVTATAGQTVFNANGGYTVGYLDVFLNGAQLQTVDFTATNGSSITLTEAAQVGDVIRLVAWGTFVSSNNVSKSGDTMTGELNIQAADARSILKLTATTGTNPVYERHSNTGGFLYVGRDGSAGVDFGAGAYAAGIWSTGAYPMVLGTNGTERMRIDSAGRVTMPNQPAFTAGMRATSFNLSGGSIISIVYDTSVLNRGNHYNTSNGRFTAPVAGVYSLTHILSARATSSSTYEAKIIKNGSNEIIRVFNNGAGYGHYAIANINVYLNAGDYVTAGGYITGIDFSGMSDINPSQTEGILSGFSGYLIG